jgi:hypothetical protein
MKPYDKGARVVQAQYGPGTVTDAHEFHTVIDFDDHGPRKFVTSIVVLERTDLPGPVRAKRASRAKKAPAKSATPKTAASKAAAAKPATVK